MVAKLKNQGEITIISIGGTLDIEQTQPFREACLKHFQAKKMIFNMENANFVGSTGLQPFMETVKGLMAGNSYGIKMVGCKSEFKRLFLSIGDVNLQIHETENSAIASFDKPAEEIIQILEPIDSIDSDLNDIEPLTEEPSGSVDSNGS